MRTKTELDDLCELILCHEAKQRIHLVMSDLQEENDGIGFYEYAGASGYDPGSDYLTGELHFEVDCSNLLLERINASHFLEYLHSFFIGDDDVRGLIMEAIDDHLDSYTFVDEYEINFAPYFAYHPEKKKACISARVTACLRIDKDY